MIIDRITTTLKYLLGIFMICAGVYTMFQPVDQHPRLGFIYDARISLVLFGIYFAASGIILVYGRFEHHVRMVTVGLEMMFIAFTFTALLNAYALHSEYIPDAALAVLTAVLHARWDRRCHRQHLDTLWR